MHFNKPTLVGCQTATRVVSVAESWSDMMYSPSTLPNAKSKKVRMLVRVKNDLNLSYEKLTGKRKANIP